VGPSEDPGLGIRTIAWAPGGRHLALGGWDGKTRVLESEGRRCVGLMSWGARVGDRNVVRLDILVSMIANKAGSVEGARRLDQGYARQRDRPVYVYHVEFTLDTER